MGWDIHFVGNKTLGEILQDEEFKIEFACDSEEGFLYVLDEDGKKCGLLVQYITKDDYKDKYPIYGMLGYGHKTLLLMHRLYEKFGIRFMDSTIQDYYALSKYCKDEKEEEELINYCCAEEMTYWLKDALSEDDELWKTLERTKPLRDRLWEEYQKRDNHS